MAPAGVFSPVPGVGGVRSAILATRRTASSRFAAISQGSLRTGVAAGAVAGAGVISPVAPMAGLAARLPTSSSTSRFPASVSSASGVRPRARTLRCRTKTSQEGTPPGPQPPRRSGFSKFQQGWKELKAETQKSAVKLVLLVLSIILANLSYRTHPYSGRALLVIAMCDRSEKFLKFVSHLAPIVAAFWKGFSGPDSN